MNDLVSAGIAAANRRAWLRRAQSAASPPPVSRERLAAICARAAAECPPPPARSVSVEELDAAVAAALARGHSSLEELRMAKIHMSQVPPRPRVRRGQCLLCGLSLELVEADCPICQLCAENAAESRKKLAGRRADTEAQLAAAEGEWQAAFTALDERDMRRWAQITELMSACDMEVATDEQRARLAKIRAALLDPADDRMSDALRRVYAADEVVCWARLGAKDALWKVNTAAAHLESAVAALRAFEAPTSDLVEVASSRPGTTYQVARDGSWCSCEGFRFRKDCKHARAQREPRAA